MAVEGTLEITISNQTALTSVPDTDSFSLFDVCEVVSPSGGDDLISCFNESDSGLFDPAYEGSLNSLLNFRNYGNI
jgi:hypothetical protein